MKLMPKKIEKGVPALYANEAIEDPIARVKFFTPDADFTWFVTEYDPEKRMCFGLVKGLETELGYFSLAELESVRGPLGLKIERDLHFSPKPLSEVR